MPRAPPSTYRGCPRSFFYFSIHALIALALVNSSAAASSSSSLPSTTNTATSSSSISTIYYVPVTVVPSPNCLSHTSFSYITMRALTGPSLGPLTTILSTVKPWSVATITAPASTTGSAGSPASYVQVDVFLSQAPFSVGPDGEESAWAKACYDPRNTLCPSNNVYGPSAPGVSCITGFPGATPTQEVGATATVFGPYQNSAARSFRGGSVEGCEWLMWEILMLIGMVAGLGFL